MKGYRIEEISSPWDLYLEGHYLGVSIGQPEHISWIDQNQEKIFSVRNQDREPVADIVCMPVPINRWDIYWPKLRILKTSHPMEIEGNKLIVLDIVASNYKQPSKELIKLVEEFFTINGGVLNNEWPLGLTFKSYKDIKKWQKSTRSYRTWNLCISTVISFPKECQTQAYTLKMAVDLLKGVFDNIYLNVDDTWAEAIIAHFNKYKVDRPTRQFFVFSPSNDKEKMNYFIEKYKEIK